MKENTAWNPQKTWQSQNTCFLRFLIAAKNPLSQLIGGRACMGCMHSHQMLLLTLQKFASEII
jgi:hypothetical protein